jgi:hypothetical protein
MRGFSPGKALIVTPPCVVPLIAPHLGSPESGPHSSCGDEPTLRKIVRAHAPRNHYCA